MRILLDSHVLVWFVLGNPRCKATTRELISRPETRVFVSAASAWEIATKARMRRWEEGSAIIRNLAVIMTDNDFTALPVSLEHGRVAGLFASPHKDPFDRMLAAQAQIETMPLVTADRMIETFGIETIW